MMTVPTLKLGLVLAVCLLSMTTNITSLRRICRVNQDDWHSSQHCLVSNETSQLIERPRQPLRPLLLPYRCPTVDTAQILKSDSTVGVFGFSNQYLADTMVLVSPKSGFMSRYLLQL